ncbi:hypothetical protein BSZ39_12110 [Bowdeniella nasicola]|uniref:Uncharacterized protein n=1 Tax=Bowdeniella nasicola TaxID=208480 RepID=A0A1Q5PZQ3_9ACTO|nr:hypothetical protein BSZ39_12110 [Bowdeniella nasicola]
MTGLFREELPAAPASATVHYLAQASWARHYQTKKKGAAHMGDSLTSLTLEAPPNPAHRVGVCSKPHLVGLAGFEPTTP